MAVDSYFAVGSTHQVCQDYADNRDGIAGLSDGCSSGIHTDFGSRLIVQHMLTHGGPTIGMMKHLRWMTDGIGLPLQSLLATRVLLKELPGDEYRAARSVCVVEGDGFVLIKSSDGVAVLRVTWPDNMPWYPVYELNPSHSETFQDVRYRVEVLSPSGEWSDNFESVLSAYSMSGFVFGVTCFKGESVVCCSDGFGTFVDSTTGKPADIQQLANQLMDFPVCSGEFLKRRVRRLKRKEWSHLRHEDDLAFIASVPGEQS